MSKQVNIVAYCDGEHDEMVLATTERTINVDDDGPRTVDLCADHDKVVQELQVLLVNGVPVRRTRKTPPPGVDRDRHRGAAEDLRVPCPEPGCDRTAKNRAGLAQHTLQGHGKSLRDYPNEGRAA
jgi:hypothetical protein